MSSRRSTLSTCKAAPRRSTPNPARCRSSTAKGTRKSLSYDRLVVATGSRLFRPNIPGLAEHGFSVDSLDDAVALDKHLHGLAKRPAVNGRDTVVVAGGGFTGIEAATEMPARLREILGKDAKTARHHRRPQQRDRARHGRRSPPRHRGRPAQARCGNPPRRRRRLARQIRRHACPAANTSKPRP